MLCASSAGKWTRVGLGWLVPVVLTPGFAVLSTQSIQANRAVWMLCVERVSAGDAAAAWLWRGQLAWAIKRPDQVRTIAKV
jgi:hypothetical protein